MIQLTEYEAKPGYVSPYGSLENDRIGFAHRFYVNIDVDRGGVRSDLIFKAMYDWCHDQFGHRGSAMGGKRRWNYYRQVIGFRRPEDAVAFKIRWHGTREFDGQAQP